MDLLTLGTQFPGRAKWTPTDKLGDRQGDAGCPCLTLYTVTDAGFTSLTCIRQDAAATEAIQL